MQSRSYTGELQEQEQEQEQEQDEKTVQVREDSPDRE